jgi:WD40 repeat protein
MRRKRLIFALVVLSTVVLLYAVYKTREIKRLFVWSGSSPSIITPDGLYLIDYTSADNRSRGLLHFWSTGSLEIARTVEIPSLSHLSSIDISSNGEFIGGQSGGNVYILNAESGNRLFEFPIDGRRILAFDFCPCNDQLIFSGIEEMHVVNLDDGSIINTMPDHGEELEYSPSGEYVAVANGMAYGWTGYVDVWDMQSYTLRYHFGVGAPIMSVVLHP